MEKQAVTVENDLKTIIYRSISGVIHRVDMAIFKIVIDYIVRNFDPAGINIVGLIDSFYYISVKPALLSFSKMFKHVINQIHGSIINLHNSPPDKKWHSTKVLSHWHGCLRD
jgi:hypothetical protein